MKTPSLERSQVVMVYSGKAGKCACGCAGSYRYTKEHKAEAEKNGGRVNEAQVTRVLALLNANPDAVNYEGLGVYWMDLGDRTYTVYTVEYLRK